MAVLKITCPSCGASIKVPEAESDRRVVRCPKCGKGFPLAMEEEGHRAPASEAREPASPKKRFRSGIAWGFSCTRVIVPVAALV